LNITGQVAGGAFYLGFRGKEEEISSEKLLIYMKIFIFEYYYISFKVLNRISNIFQYRYQNILVSW